MGYCLLAALMTETILPPDQAQLDLAKIVNKALPSGAQVNFFRVERDDGAPNECGLIYQFGPQRATIRTPGVLTEHDAAEIIAGVKDWIRQMRFRGRWTEDPNEAA
jgi:hypothetical protein